MSKRDQLGSELKSRTRVGKYELGKTLGQGNFAKVKFAKNVHSAQTVAIKILSRDHLLCHKMVHQPENLVLDSYGDLKVADFGLSTFSRQVHEDGLFHTACGTPNYVAPEVLTDKGYDGTATDVWSCGVILFVLMAGYLPFDDSNMSTLYKKVGA